MNEGFSAHIQESMHFEKAYQAENLLREMKSYVMPICV